MSPLDLMGFLFIEKAFPALIPGPVMTHFLPLQNCKQAYAFWVRHLPVMALAALPYGFTVLALHYAGERKDILLLANGFIALLAAQAFFDTFIQRTALEKKYSWKEQLKESWRLSLAYCLFGMLIAVFIVMVSLISSAVLASVLKALNPSMPALSGVSDLHALGSSGQIGMTIISWILGLGIAFLVLRFSFTAPLTIKTGRIHVFTSWKKTRGHVLPMILSVSLVFVPFILLFLVVFWGMSLFSNEGISSLKELWPAPWLGGLYGWLFLLFVGGLFQALAALWQKSLEKQDDTDDVKRG